MTLHRPCSHPGCSRQAVASMRHSNSQRIVRITPLQVKPVPGMLDLCVQHLARAKAPVGWTLENTTTPGHLEVDDPDISEDELIALAEAVYRTSEPLTAPPTYQANPSLPDAGIAPSTPGTRAQRPGSAGPAARNAATPTVSAHHAHRRSATVTSIHAPDISVPAPEGEETGAASASMTPSAPKPRENRAPGRELLRPLMEDSAGRPSGRHPSKQNLPTRRTTRHLRAVSDSGD